MNRKTSPVSPSLSQSLRIKVPFDLTDPTERDALRWIQGFHEPAGIYRLLEVDRGCSTEGKRVVLMRTRAQPQRRGAQPEWLVIEYVIDEIRVSFRTYSTRTVAKAAFQAAAAGLTPPADSPELRGPT